MDLIKVKIMKDENELKYIKMLRQFDPNIAVGEYKKRIDSNIPAFEFDLDKIDWMYYENMTEYKWHRAFYKFLQSLQKAGAKLELIEEYNALGSRVKTIITMQQLDQRIKFIKGISDDCDKYPD